MSKWIDDNLFHFQIYGFLHITIIVGTILLIVFLYYNRKKIQSWKYHDRPMRYFIAAVLFFMLAIYYGDLMIRGVWNYQNDLPLHFCFISNYLFIYALLMNRRTIFRYVYFFSFAGPLPAILIPDVTLGIQSIVFWQYFISHYFFLVGTMYALYVLEWEVTKKDAIKAFVLANVIFLLVYCFNLIFDSNYIMTSSLPDIVIELFPFTAYFNYPILWLELAGCLAFMVSWIPLYLLYKKR